MGDPVIRGSRLSLLSLENCRFQFQKRRQLFIRSRNEPLSIIPMRVNDPDRCPLESIAKTQPQFQPALLRLSAMISQFLMADGFWSFWTPRCSCNANSRHAVKHDGSFRKYGRSSRAGSFSRTPGCSMSSRRKGFCVDPKRWRAVAQFDC
jgi:hypothetical protein